MTDHAHRLLIVKREWPYGLAYFGDPESTEELPELNDLGVSPGRTQIGVSVLHEVDGEATAEVWFGPVDVEGQTCVYDGEFATESGEIALSDAPAEEFFTSEALLARTYRLRIYIDDLNQYGAERVVFALTSLV